MFNNNFEAWIEAALIRALKTAAEAAIAVIGTNALGITDVDWIAVASAAALAAVVSLLWAVKGLPEVPDAPSVEIVESEDDGSED